MAVQSIVGLSELENFLDCSAEYYRPEHLNRSNRLRVWPVHKVRKIAFVTDGEHGSPDWDPSSGIRYISADFISANFINDFPMKNISAIQDARNARCRVRHNDVLVYSVGAYAGLAARSEPHLFPASIPRSVAIIRLYENAPFKAGFLSVFLNSEYGRFQTIRLRAGNSQPVLALEKINQIELPELPITDQEAIDQLYEDAYQNRLETKDCFTQAQHLLESKLGLDKLSFKKPMGYTAQFRDIEASRRLDPEHFYPAFQHLVANLPRRIKLIPLGTQISFCQRGKQPVYSDHGLPVINSKHVQPNKIVCEDSRTAIAGTLDELRIRYGDTLVNGTGRGTIGRTAPYLLDHPSLPDNHVTILRSTTLDPAYLSFYLNSLAGQLQVEMHQRGTSGQLELYPFDIRKFLVWVAPESFQKEIRALYDQAAAKEKQSKELLHQAKTRVEQLIAEAASDASRKGIKERMR